MKKWLTALLVLAGLFAGIAEASAQYAQVYRRGVSLYSGGTALTQGQMQTLFDGLDGVTYDDWRKASCGFNAGKGLLIGFGALTGAGLVTLGVGAVGLMVEGIAVGIGTMFVLPLAAASGQTVNIEYGSRFGQVAMAGVSLIGGGLLCMAAGTTVYCIYKKKLDRMTAAFNEQSGCLQLSFGMTGNGIGLSLNF